MEAVVQALGRGNRLPGTGRYEEDEDMQLIGKRHYSKRTYNPILAPTASINVHACRRVFSSCETDNFPRVFSHKSCTCWGVKYGLCSLTVETGIPIPGSAMLCEEVRGVCRSKFAVVVHW